MASLEASGHTPNGGLLSLSAHRECNRYNFVGSLVSFALVGFLGKENYFKCLLVLRNACPAVPEVFDQRSPLKNKTERARQVERLCGLWLSVCLIKKDGGSCRWGSRSKNSVQGSLLEHLNSGGTLTVGNGYIQGAAPSPLSQAAGLVSGRGDQWEGWILRAAEAGEAVAQRHCLGTQQSLLVQSQPSYQGHMGGKRRICTVGAPAWCM